MARQWPNLRVFRNERNLPFAEGVNLGMRASRGEYFLWLNNDTVLARGWLEGLLKAVESRKEIGAVGPMTDFMAPLEQLSRPFRTRTTRRTVDTSYLGGFCFLVKRSAAEVVGALDERFIWGWEDMDYSMRLRQAGFRLALARDVFVHHDGSRSLKSIATPEREAMDVNNRRLIRSKWIYTEHWQSELRSQFERMPALWDLNRPTASIVVVSRGRWDKALNTLRSIRECAPGVPYEVFTVGLDAGPVTPALKRLASQWPQLRILGAWKSVSYPFAVNCAIRTSCGDYVAVLSEGTQVRAGWIERLIMAVDSEPTAAVVAPNPTSEPTARNGGGGRIPLKRVHFVRGTCLLIPRWAFSRVGDFDERFESGLGAEDFCLRAKQRGYHVFLAGNAGEGANGDQGGPLRGWDLKLLFDKWAGHPLYSLETKQ